MMPKKFTVPWADVDPELKHGGIPGELENQFVAPDLNDNLTTTNRDIHGIVTDVTSFASDISMHPEADAEQYPGRSLVEATLLASATLIENVIDVTHTHSTRFFSFTHAVPPSSVFHVRPIRYPVRNRFAEDFLHYCIGMTVELAENSRNALHKGLDPDAARIILAPLYEWKATVMKKWFDKEVAGEISSAELAELYEGKPFPNPSYPHETTTPADAADVANALTGLDVMAWLPTPADWTVFGALRDKRYTPERILQPEGARPITEDVAPPGPVAPGSSTGGPNP